MPGHIIEGHAIVSAEGAIADAAGAKPPGLRIDADWTHFQRQLDQSALTVLGRLTHEADPSSVRRRLVITSAGKGLVRSAPRTWQLDPARMPLQSALDQLVPEGGRIAVVGGRRVFDLFFEHGFAGFHLTIAGRCRLPGGVPVLTGVLDAADARHRLVANGLVVAERRTLDPEADAVLWRFVRPASQPPAA